MCVLLILPARSVMPLSFFPPLFLLRFTSPPSTFRLLGRINPPSWAKSQSFAVQFHADRRRAGRATCMSTKKRKIVWRKRVGKGKELHRGGGGGEAAARRKSDCDFLEIAIYQRKPERESRSVSGNAKNPVIASADGLFHSQMDFANVGFFFFWLLHS